MAKIINLTAKNFKKKLFDNDEPKIVFFTINGCCPCTTIEPIFKELAEDYDGRIEFFKYQALLEKKEDDELVEEMKAKPFPCIAYIKDKKIIKRLKGEKSERQYREMCIELLKN